jgi:16S rRNA (guanine966-N2)-methyltransferase
MSDIRILGGRFKGTKLLTLDGDNTRPTMGRIVENIFNILSHNHYVDNFTFRTQKVLDIFAGSGRLGLEALSRGAELAVFIDNHHKAGKIIQDNIQKCHATQYAHYLNCDALTLNISCSYAPFSLVFCDAPYDNTLSSTVINNLIAKKWLADNALLCIETEKNYHLDVIPNITLVDKRDYGITSVHFLKYDLLF